MRFLSLLLLPCLTLAMPADIVGADTAGYLDALARNQMLWMSSAAYSDHPEQCVAQTWKNATMKRIVTVNCDVSSIASHDTCSGFTAVSHDDKAIIISYRGTNNAFELVMEGDESVLQDLTNWYTGGQVSKYFYDGFTKLWNGGMKDDFLSLQSQYKDYEVWVTGHSLGGAFASLASSYVSYMKYATVEKIKLYTFGQPRTGETKFAAAHDKDVKYQYRVTHNRDLVPHIPFKNMKNYYHHMTEVFYKENMAAGQKYVVCAGVDESSICSNGNTLPNDSVKDHLTYFDKDVSGWGIAGCK